MAGAQKVYKGKLTFGDKVYDCEIKNGVPYVDGKTVDDFLKTLDAGYIKILADKGKRVLGVKKSIKN